MQAEEKSAVEHGSVSVAQVPLADWQTFDGSLVSNGAQHVRHQLLYTEGRCPAPVSPRISVVKSHRPAVCCKVTRDDHITSIM